MKNFMEEFWTDVTGCLSTSGRRSYAVMAPALALFTAVLLVASAAPANAQLVKPDCVPEILQPADGAENVSLAPEVRFGRDRDKSADNCDVDRVVLTIEQGGQTVYETEKDCCGNLANSIPVEYFAIEVPEGELEPGTTYQLRMEMINRSIAQTFDEDAGNEPEITFTTRARSGSGGQGEEADRQEADARPETGIFGNVWETRELDDPDKISNVEITFWNEDRSVERTVTTDGSGHYEIQLPEGVYRARLTHPNYQTLNRDVGINVPDPRGDEMARQTFHMTPEGGVGEQGPEGEPDHTVIIASQDVPGGTAYTLDGGGQLKQIEGSLLGMQLTKQGNDEVSGNRATGRVAGGADGYEVYGDLPSIDVAAPGNANVFVDGNPYHTIVITSRDIEGETGYTIEGGGQLEQVDGTLAGIRVSIQGNDNVSGTRATGHVAGAADGFIVTGPVPNITLENPGNAKVYVDGQVQ